MSGVGGWVAGSARFDRRARAVRGTHAPVICLDETAGRFRGQKKTETVKREKLYV